MCTCTLYDASVKRCVHVQIQPTTCTEYMYIFVRATQGPEMKLVLWNKATTTAAATSHSPRDVYTCTRTNRYIGYMQVLWDSRYYETLI